VQSAAVDGRPAISGRIPPAVIDLGLGELFLVGLGVGKEQGVGRGEIAVELDEAARVDQRRDPAVYIDREVMVAFIADTEPFVVRASKERRLAGGAVRAILGCRLFGHGYVAPVTFGWRRSTPSVW
jgi:hypothetical protein